jgi:hypothetical protein
MCLSIIELLDRGTPLPASAKAWLAYVRDVKNDIDEQCKQRIEQLIEAYPETQLTFNQ